MKRGALAGYGALGLPLAMVALPVYMQVPSWYVAQVGVSLSLVGLVLFGARIFDTVQDPFLGRLIDLLARRGRLGVALWAAALVLALAFAGLWFPPSGASAWQPVAWLAFMLALVYAAHSLLNITLLSWGARLSADTRVRTQASAWRESAGLAGVIVASVLPQWLLRSGSGSGNQAMAVYALVFAFLLAAGLVALLRGAPPWQRSTQQATPGRVRAVAAVRRLWPAYFVNALAVSIPGTLALFFIADRIDRAAWSGYFLSAYFVAGAAGMPVWTRLAGRFGAAPVWAGAMVLAVCTFVWAGLLGRGDALAYGAVCVLSGLALGADLVLPPVLLAAAIPPNQDPGAHYGVWTLLGKLATAMAALSLPLLTVLGYRPGPLGGGTGALTVAYAVIPCALKLLALTLLYVLVIAKKE